MNRNEWPRLDQEEYEVLRSKRPGGSILRVRRRRKLRPLLLSWSAIVEGIKDFALETPFFILLPIVVTFLLAFSAGIYLAETGAPGSHISSYSDALWDGVVLMTTAGVMTEPVTTAGHVVGAVWTILGCLLFYGMIIASASAYFLAPLSAFFLLPRRGKEAQLVGTIQYHLGRLEELSLDDLEVLKETTVGLIDSALQRKKQQPL